MTGGFDYHAAIRLDYAMVLSMAQMPFPTLRRTVADLDPAELMRVITVGLVASPLPEIEEWRAHLVDHLGPEDEACDPLEQDRRTALAVLLAARARPDG